MPQEPVSLEHFDGGNAGGGGERIAAEGGGVHAGPQVLREINRGEHGTTGDTSTKTLGQCHHVGRDLEMLIAKPSAGTAAAALHLIEHEQEVPLVGDPPQSLEKSLRRRHHAPFTKDRLHHDAAGVLVDEPLHGCEIAVRGVLEAGHHRPEARVVFRLGGGRNAPHRAAMKAAGEGDDLISLPLRPQPDELNGRLVGLGA